MEINKKENISSRVMGLNDNEVDYDGKYIFQAF